MEKDEVNVEEFRKNIREYIESYLKEEEETNKTKEVK